MAARFLHVWPDTPLYRSILDRRVVDDESALARLKRISGEGGEVDTPRKLPVSGLITRGKRPSLAHTLGLSHHEILPSEVVWVRGFEPRNQSVNQCVLASITDNDIVAISSVDRVVPLASKKDVIESCNGVVTASATNDIVAGGTR